LFEEYKEADSGRKQDIAKMAVHDLEIHAALEARLIYSAIREDFDADEVMNEAGEEHHLVHVLMAELKKLKSSDERFEATFLVLADC
jgi:hypothetical protein